MSANDRHNSWVKLFFPLARFSTPRLFRNSPFQPTFSKDGWEWHRFFSEYFGLPHSTCAPDTYSSTYHWRTYLLTYLLTHVLTYLLTPWSRVLLEKLTISQLVKIFSAYCGTRRFITAFRSARQLSLSWARSIQQSMPPFRRYILILSFRLPLGLCPTGFPTKTLYTPLLSPICSKCPAYLILLDLITRTISGEDYIS